MRVLAFLLLVAATLSAQDKPKEADYYRIRNLFIPERVYLEGVSFLEREGREVVVGSRRGEIWYVKGMLEPEPDPEYRLFASGLHEVLGLAERDGWLWATQQAEVSRMRDRDGDGRADRFECMSDSWGFGKEHEFTFGSQFDRDGYLWIVLCLSGSYTSEHPFRGWCLRVSADGETIPTCSGLRSPGGIGEYGGAMFYTESQGPWNGACSIKHLVPGGFMGHPISFPWYERAKNLKRPAMPTGTAEARLHTDAKRIPELVPPVVWLPYKKMGQSASAIVVDRSGGRFGPFAGQLFVPDYTLSLVSRVFVEKIDGVWQGACFPFREGFRTGLIGAVLSKNGYLVVGGCSRGWPTRGTAPYALQRVEWTGKTPFEVHEMRIRKEGFRLTFTLPIDPATARDPRSYELETYTYHYRRQYGSPEIDRTKPRILRAVPGSDGRSVDLVLEKLNLGHVHELRMPGLRSKSGSRLLHDVAYYTVNRIPK